MKRAIAIIGVLLVALTTSCRKAETGNEKLAGFLVGTWVLETPENQLRITYDANGTWRIRMYLLSGDGARKTDFKHRFMDALGLPAAMYCGNSDMRGKWRVDNERLFWTPDGKPEVEIKSPELTATHWTMIATDTSVDLIKRPHWYGMTDAEILAQYRKRSESETDPHEDKVRRETPDEVREAYWLGQMYMLLEHYAKSMDQFRSLQKNFPNSKYAGTAQLHIHVCQAKLAMKTRGWSKVESNLNTVAGLLQKFREKTASNAKLHEWTEMMTGLTVSIRAECSTLKKHCDAMADARRLLDSREFDKALEILDILYNNFFELADRLEVEEMEELLDIRDRAIKAGKVRAKLDKTRGADVLVD
ncbi:MAG: hypothetical protein H8E53_08405 [Planctomycetes bacterium]|nr:hypothetical protein [Planctomycetota bacterium]